MGDCDVERKAVGRGMTWASSDLELLQKLIDDGLNMDEIIIQMEDETGVKRSQNAILTITRLKKIKLPVSKEFEAITDYVRDHYLVETASEMSYKSGYSANLIGRIMKKNKWKTPIEVSKAYKEKRCIESLRYKSEYGTYKCSLCWVCHYVNICERWEGKKVWDKDEVVLYFGAEGWMPITVIRECSHMLKEKT
jgi:hypothetical protein